MLRRYAIHVGWILGVGTTQVVSNVALKHEQVNKRLSITRAIMAIHDTVPMITVEVRNPAPS